ncbi:hypothetical protein G6F62_014608 [Rhizopus arrhizus]|nr:hypothetical protein G6F31_018878 [Rhizopus arrhizus]KAG1310497.1 hypothetical protein G6F62_014608 [Rhizopus arrhizus]
MAEPDAGHAQADQRAHDAACCDGGQAGGPWVHAHQEQLAGDHHGHADDGAYRQVDAAHDHQQGHADHDDAFDGKRQQHRAYVFPGQEMRRREAHADGKERNDQ